MELTLQQFKESYAHFGEPTKYFNWEHFSNQVNEGYFSMIEDKIKKAYDFEVKKQNEYKSLSKEELLDEITKLRLELYYKLNN